MTDVRPDYPKAIIHPSPNHGERRNGRTPDCILLHYTGMPTGEGALARLCDPEAEVSSHYLVFEDGSVLQLVSEARRAWHAGAGRWKDDTDLNSCSIGVEIVNPGHDGALPPYPKAQIEAVASLCRDIAARHAIAAERILAHSDIAPGRKRDPGEHFPWETLHALGVGHLVHRRQVHLEVLLDRRPQQRAHFLLHRLRPQHAIEGIGLEHAMVAGLHIGVAGHLGEFGFAPIEVQGEEGIGVA
jgi:N-acetylmuramoyl-L-alanine amidase